MTTPEQIRSLVREELDAHDVRHRFAPRQPARIKDPATGQEWITGALRKAEIVRFVVWLIGGLLAVTLSALAIYSKVEILPEVDHRIELHSTAARRQMEEIAPRFATASDLAALRKDTEVGATERRTQLIAIKEQLDRIEQRLSAMGR